MSTRDSNSERPLASKRLSAGDTRQNPPVADRPRQHDARAEERLIRQCLAGDETAWERLYRRYHPRLRKAIGLLLKSNAADADLIEEIAARVWYALLRADCRLLGTYDANRDSTLEGFLMGLARIEILRYARSERRRHAHEFIGGRRRLQEQRITDGQVAALLDEFASTLTPGEKDFLETFLTGTAEGENDVPLDNLSTNNIYQRRRRIRVKLNRFFNDS